MTNVERARKWLKETWPWSLDDDGPSEREVSSLTALLDGVTDDLLRHGTAFRGEVLTAAGADGERDDPVGAVRRIYEKLVDLGVTPEQVHEGVRRAGTLPPTETKVPGV